MYAAGVRYEDLVGVAEAVVKPGYGIVSECIANDAAILYTSRAATSRARRHRRGDAEVMRSAFINHDDLFAGKWESHLDKLLAQAKPKKKPETNGASRRGHSAEGARQAAQETARPAEGRSSKSIATNPSALAPPSGAVLSRSSSSDTLVVNGHRRSITSDPPTRCAEAT